MAQPIEDRSPSLALLVTALSLFAATSFAQQRTIPVYFADQPNAPAALVPAECRGTPNTQIELDNIRHGHFAVAIRGKGHLQVAAVRIGRVQQWMKYHSSTRDSNAIELPRHFNDCGLMTTEIFVVDAPLLHMTGVWLYLAEVQFTDGSRWSIGSADEEWAFQEQLASRD